MQRLLLALALIGLGCPSAEPSRPLDTSVRVAGALVDADGSETPFDTGAAGFFESCREDCAYIDLEFSVGGSELASQWTFPADDPITPGASPLTYVNVRWQDEARFGRQGEGPSSWGELPGGDIVIEESCSGCGLSGYLDGAAEVTVYGGWNELPTGEILRVDRLEFDEVPREPGLELH